MRPKLEFMIETDTQTQLPLPTLLSRLSCSDLRPSPSVNYLFSQLVGLSLTDIDPTIHQRILARKLAAAGEFELEKSWAERIMNGESLDGFPYLDNYQALAEHEYAALMRHASRTDSWAFVGSGPLPLSQLLFERMHGGVHTYVERDPAAHHRGAMLTAALGADVDRHHILADAQDCDYADHDIVLMAALVGDDDVEKQKILQRIAGSMKPGALLAARSVPYDGRTLLYPRLTTLPSGVTLLEETSPPEGVINSLVIMRVNERS